MTWNAAGIQRGRTKELALARLLQEHSVDVAAITEAELPSTTASMFAIEGYTTFLPQASPDKKVRVILLVRTTLAITASASSIQDSTEGLSTWLDLCHAHYRVRVGGVYRPWKGIKEETSDLKRLTDEVRRATLESKYVVILGDFNLDLSRHNDSEYSRKQLLSVWKEATEEAGLTHAKTSPTWTSFGHFGETGKRTSTIDHVYFSGLQMNVTVLDDSTTDHRPVLATTEMKQPSKPLQTIFRRNFKGIKRTQLERSLGAWPWADIYALRDVEEVHAFIYKGITTALNKIAPVRAIKVRPTARIYLSAETRAAMTARDAARETRHYRTLRNKAASLVRRDKLRSNLQRLKEAQGNPKAVWSLANSALGKSTTTPLPSSLKINGADTETLAETAAGVNQFYIDKVDKLREKVPNTQAKGSTASVPSKRRFHFSFTNEKKIARIINKLGSTSALGNDNIPVSVLKLGVKVLASPISHLVNMSLSAGQVPSGFKKGIVVPVFKGKGKCPTDPSSYRPISLLPAMSKILEVVVKDALTRHLLQTNSLPNSQYGFRTGRSTTTAIGAAHAHWTKALQRGKIVGILAFDFSSAFDTVDPETLLSKLHGSGVQGKELKWFQSYLRGGQQCVDWDGTRSSYLPVKYGVRQGSILGPLLFITLMATLPQHIGLEEDEICGYADDVCLWIEGKTISEVRARLNQVACSFVDFAAANALSLNESKTQLLLAGHITKVEREKFTIQVGKANIHPSSQMELLGVKFDTKLSSTPHVTSLAKAVRQRASLIARLSNHIPRGPYLRLLAQGLVYGKVSYAAASTISPRLPGEASSSSGTYQDIQVALNDVARTLTGHKRTDKVPIRTLLCSAGLPSLNEVVIRALATETWKAHHSNDGPDSTRNPLGKAIFESQELSATSMATRARTQGQVPLPLSFAAPTMVYSAAKLWNESEDLRSARTLSAAKNIAKQLAKAAPI